MCVVAGEVGMSASKSKAQPSAKQVIDVKFCVAQQHQRALHACIRSIGTAAKLGTKTLFVKTQNTKHEELLLNSKQVAGVVIKQRTARLGPAELEGKSKLGTPPPWPQSSV